MKHVLAFLLLLSAASFGFSQSEAPVKGPRPYTFVNSVQLELGGAGVAYSLNYERILLNGRWLKTGIRGGLGITPPFQGESTPQVRIPILVNEQLSFGSQHIELGAGVSIMNTYNFLFEKFGFMFGRFTSFGVMSLGYRYQKPEGRLILKAAYTPMVSLRQNGSGPVHVFQGFGVTVGYAF
jgi:hypothetical protein